MVKTKFKRAVSLVMAAVLSLGVFANIGTTAYAASGTKEDGEFYTPSCAVKLIAELIEPYSGVVYEQRCLGLIQHWERCA